MPSDFPFIFYLFSSYIEIAKLPELAWWGVRRKSVGRNRISRSGQDSIGRVAADWETGADDAGNSKSCDRGEELVAICPEAWAVVRRMSVDEAVM